MTTLTDFLLARIAEDEDAAKSPPPHHFGTLDGRPLSAEVAIEPNGFDRALAEVEAKRRIVTLHGGDYDGECQSPSHLDGPCRTLRALALPYADHPDCRDEWRP